MPIEVVCPSCGSSHRVKDELAGKKLKCKGCQTILPIPAAADAAEVDPWENLDENDGGEELAPVIRKPAAGKTKRAAAPRQRDEQPSLEQVLAARKFGVGMMIFGGVVTVAPLFGLQLRSLREHGYLTPVIGVILLLIGIISFVASQSPILAKVLTLGTKGILWAIIAFMLLIAIGAIVLIIGMAIFIK